MLEKSRVELHLLSLGFHPVEVLKFSGQLQKWVTNSGIEWTVDRLKSVKTAFLNSLTSSDGGYTPPVGWAVRRNRSGKSILKDALVHKVLTLPNTETNLRVKEAFLRTYTVLKLSKPSKKQEEKMMTAIEGPYTGSIDISSSSSRMMELSILRPVTREAFARCQTAAHSCSVLPDFLGTSKRSPTIRWERRFGSPRLQGPFISTSSRNDVSVAYWRDLFMRDDKSFNIWRSHCHDVSRSFGYQETVPLTYEQERVDTPAGKVVILQDGGAKARWIANPFLAYQALGEPLKVKLQEYLLLQYPEVFVHDQDAARAVVVTWLSENEKVWSYDCTSFTDRFPVAYQRMVLENLRTQGIASQFDVDSFDAIIGKEWMYRDKMVRWRVGQPLGYGPSFFLATLAHAVLLDRLTAEVGAAPMSFCIVGDDIVIKDERLAEAYRSTMTLGFGVDINLSKSLVSDRFGEFLGKLITKWGVNPSIKVRSLVKKSQFQKSFTFYGLKALSHLPDELVGKCSGLFLPSELGGADLRLPGTSYNDWLEITRQEDFAQAKLLKELDAFYDGNPVEESLKKLKLDLRSKYFKGNSPLALGLTDWAQLVNRRVTTLNRWTGFPDNPLTSTSRRETSVLRTGWSNTFVHLQDTAHSLKQLQGVSVAMILTKHGFLNPSEKPYTANHIRKTYERKADIDPEGKSNFDDQGRKPFKTSRVIARWLKCKEGKDPSKESIKTFLKRFYSFQRNQDGNLRL